MFYKLAISTRGYRLSYPVKRVNRLLRSVEILTRVGNSSNNSLGGSCEVLTPMHAGIRFLGLEKLAYTVYTPRGNRTVRQSNIPPASMLYWY